jgi:hypothetical protein
VEGVEKDLGGCLEADSMFDTVVPVFFLVPLKSHPYIH